MKTLAKIIGVLLLLLIVTAVAITLYVKFFFDPNDLRSQITQHVKERTGRDLVIEGDFALSTFPWLSVDVGQTRLSDDPAFGNDSLLSFSHASASVKLMPLLKKQIELGTTSIEGANVTLIRSAEGINNWDAFLEKLSDPSAKQSNEGSGFVAQTLGAFNVSDADVSYTDQATGQSMALSGFNMSTGNLVPDQPFDLDLSTGLVADNVDVQVSLNGRTTLGAGTLSIDNPKITAAGNHFEIPFNQFELDLDGSAINITETQYQISSPTIAWSVNQGRESADTISTAKGDLSVNQVTFEGETIKLGVLELNFEVGLTDGETATGDLSVNQATLEGETIKLGDLALNFDADLTDGDSAKGELAVNQATLAGKVLDLADVALDFDVAMPQGAATRVTGNFSANDISGTSDDLVFDQPLLNYDTALAIEGFSQSKGMIKGQRLTLKESDRLRLNTAEFDGEVAGTGLFAGGEKIDLKSDTLVFNMNDGALRLNNYTAKLLDMNLSGSVTGKDVLGSPQLSGPIKIAPFNLRAFLQKAEIPVDTADDQALSQASIDGKFSYTDQSMGMTKLTAMLDQSKITGSASLNNGTQVMDLKIDKLDVDRYLSPPPSEDTAQRAVDEIEIPAQQLRELNARGRLRIGAMTMSGIESQNVDINLDANNGAVRVFPVGAQLYGGRYAGDIRIDASGEVPKMSLNERFENVDIGALTMALADTQRLTGRITGSLVMTAQGHNTSDLKATSNGQAEFSVADGVLQGVNVMETVRNIVAAANKEPGVPDQPDQTEFRKLSGTANINQGVLSNNDLSVEIPLMRVVGEGSLNLNTKAIDYRVGAKVVQEEGVPLEKELRFISDYTLPLFISGTYEAPVVDKARSITDLAAQHIKLKAKERLLDVLSDRLGLPGKDKAPEGNTDESGDKSGGASEGASKDGTADASAGEESADEAPLTPEEERERKEEELKDELDNRLKDKLKDLLGG